MDPEEPEEIEAEVLPRPDSTREDVLAAMDELVGDAGDDKPAPRDYRRDESGRFAPAAAEPQPAPRRGPVSPPPAAGAAAGAGATAPAQEKQPQPTQTPTPAHVPQWWKGEHGDFATLPPAAQQAIMAREAQFQRYASDAGRRLKQWEPIEQALAEKTEELKARGVQPQQYLSDMIAVESALVKDVLDSRSDGEVYLDALEWLAQRYYGADLNTLLDRRDAAAPKDAPSTAIEQHPLVQRLIQEVNELRGGLNATQQREQAALAREQEKRRASIRQEFEAFAKDKPLLQAELSAPEGAARPMITIMQRLLVSQAAANFEDAYEQAKWLHPPAREALLKEQRNSHAQRARAAAVSPRAQAPTPGAARTGSRESVEESVRASLEELGT